nr:putative ribonuclease H-like domain-containing protein [Tanacetum cinerariifolium]
MARVAKDQGGFSQMFSDDFHTCMFACFLSQEEPKRVFKNKKDERGIVVRNKARLVAQGHTQEEGIEYEEVFTLVARIEAIRLFLAYASFIGFMVYLMDVKSAFLYGTIKEEVYVCQPPRFEDPDHPDKVYKVVKALYGLHQAPKAWYETLAKYLLENDDIIFGATNNDLCKSFEKLMKDKFQMSSMGELTFFLGLQVKQKKDRIFISHDKYVSEILRKFRLTEGKSASTLIDTEKPLLKDHDGEDVDVHTYRLISWQCKKQIVMATSSTEAEYTNNAGYSKCYGVFEKDVTCTKYLKCWLPYHTTNGSQFTMFNPHQELASPDQTVSGKDSSNLLMADTLPEIVWYSTYHITLMKSWLVQKQTTLGKDKSNPLIVDSLLKTIWSSIHHILIDKVLTIPGKMTTGVNTPRCDEDRLELIDLTVFLLPKVEKVGIRVSVVEQQVSVVSQQTTVDVKKVNDVIRLQALVEKKKVVVTEATIREALRLDDAEGVECLPNEEIFAELARIGYEKLSTKLTFYKAFFSSYLVRNVDSPSKFYMYLSFLQLMIRKQVGDLSTHTTKYTSPALTQKVFANMQKVGNGFSGVETPLFAGMLVEQQVAKEGDTEVHSEEVNAGDAAEGDVTAAHREVPTTDEEPSIPSPTPPTPPP